MFQPDEALAIGVPAAKLAKRAEPYVGDTLEQVGGPLAVASEAFTLGMAIYATVNARLKYEQAVKERAVATGIVPPLPPATATVALPASPRPEAPTNVVDLAAFAAREPSVHPHDVGDGLRRGDGVDVDLAGATVAETNPTFLDDVIAAAEGKSQAELVAENGGPLA